LTSRSTRSPRGSTSPSTVRRRACEAKRCALRLRTPFIEKREAGRGRSARNGRSPVCPLTRPLPASLPPSISLARRFRRPRRPDRSLRERERRLRRLLRRLPDDSVAVPRPRLRTECDHQGPPRTRVAARLHAAGARAGGAGEQLLGACRDRGRRGAASNARAC
jgi:hypothetical protein